MKVGFFVDSEKLASTIGCASKGGGSGVRKATLGRSALWSNNVLQCIEGDPVGQGLFKGDAYHATMVDAVLSLSDSVR
jgi:hypothetical protein